MTDFIRKIAKRTSLGERNVEEVLEAAIDEMGWTEIDAYYDERRKGQSIYEDAGGYMLRCLGRLFGVKPKDEIINYQQAAKAMIETAKK